MTHKICVISSVTTMAADRSTEQRTRYLDRFIDLVNKGSPEEIRSFILFEEDGPYGEDIYEIFKYSFLHASVEVLDVLLKNLSLTTYMLSYSLDHVFVLKTSDPLDADRISAVLNVLSANGVSIDDPILAFDGMTLLEEAVNWYRPSEYVNLLLEHGSDARHENMYGLNTFEQVMCLYNHAITRTPNDSHIDLFKEYIALLYPKIEGISREVLSPLQQPSQIDRLEEIKYAPGVKAQSSDYLNRWSLYNMTTSTVRVMSRSGVIVVIPQYTKHVPQVESLPDVDVPTDQYPSLECRHSETTFTYFDVPIKEMVYSGPKRYRLLSKFPDTRGASKRRTFIVDFEVAMAVTGEHILMLGDLSECGTYYVNLVTISRVFDVKTEALFREYPVMPETCRKTSPDFVESSQ